MTLPFVLWALSSLHRQAMAWLTPTFSPFGSVQPAAAYDKLSYCKLQYEVEYQPRPPHRACTVLYMFDGSMQRDLASFFTSSALRVTRLHLDRTFRTEEEPRLHPVMTAGLIKYEVQGPGRYRSRSRAPSNCPANWIAALSSRLSLVRPDSSSRIALGRLST